MTAKVCALCGRELRSTALLTVDGEKVEVCFDANGCRRTVLEARRLEGVSASGRSD